MVRLNYFEPRYRLSQVAGATGFSLNTLRSNFQRDWFHSHGSGVNLGQGRAQRLCLADVMVLAIARRLIALGLHPNTSFNAALPFGRAAKTPKGLPPRWPGELFPEDDFETVMVWKPGRVAEILPVRKADGIKLEQLTFDDDEDATVCLHLNPIERRVFTKLNVRLPEESGD
jgi:hypothetical protein